MTDGLDTSAQVVVKILQEHGTWLTAKIVSRRAAAIGVYVHPRMIGDIASALNGSVIGSGRGYKLAKYATEDEILACWQADMRRSIGTGKRARDVIHYARKNRLLGERDTSDDKLNQLLLKIYAEAEKGAPPQAAARTTQKPAPPAPVTTHLITVHLVVEVPMLGDGPYYQHPLAACTEAVAAQAFITSHNSSPGTRLVIFAHDVATATESLAQGSTIFCCMVAGCAEALFTDINDANRNLNGRTGEVVTIPVLLGC